MLIILSFFLIEKITNMILTLHESLTLENSHSYDKLTESQTKGKNRREKLETI
jgi:hypothetical protein